MKVALFGASKAGEFFLSQNPELNVIAVADNDRNRHGQTLMGKPIVAPQELLHISVDKIIITSQWVDAIQRQLVEDLGIDASRIQVPTKRQVKADLPFSHPPSLALAHTLLIRLQQFLREHHLQACLDSGTLLGVIRQQALIPWDDDIDLAVDSTDFPRLLDIMPKFFERLPNFDQLDWKIQAIAVNGRECCINLEFQPLLTGDYVPFDISLQMRETKGEYSELVSSAGIFFAPAHHFASFSEIRFLNQTFYIPADAENFLTFMYGNWKHPQRDTRITEYQNRRTAIPVNEGQVIVTKRSLEPENC